jgi:hypothetical protein
MPKYHWQYGALVGSAPLFARVTDCGERPIGMTSALDDAVHCALALQEDTPRHATTATDLKARKGIHLGDRPHPSRSDHGEAFASAGFLGPGSILSVLKGSPEMKERRSSEQM